MIFHIDGAASCLLLYVDFYPRFRFIASSLVELIGVDRWEFLQSQIVEFLSLYNSLGRAFQGQNSYG